MLDDLGDVRLVSAADLAGDAFGQVDEAAVYPVLPEDADGGGADGDAEGRRVGLDHAEGAVDGPEDEEDDEHVVRVPEALVVGAPRLLDRRQHHAHERHEHDVAAPPGPGRQVGGEKSIEAEVVLGRDLREVVPVRDGVDPGEEDDGPRRRDVEGDILVELDDTVQRCLPGDGDEGPADGEEDQGDIDMEDEGRGPRYHVRWPECVARGLETVLDSVVDETEGKHKSVQEYEDEDEAGIDVSATVRDGRFTQKRLRLTSAGSLR